MPDSQMMLFDIDSEYKNAPKAYTGIYSMHKYWSKKPYNIIRRLILEYSEENDIVLDPFCGSGISVTESVFTNRKAFGIDINPSAIFITRQMLLKVSPRELKEQFIQIKNNCKEKINNLYTVKRNGKKYIGTHFLWENGYLSEVWYSDGNNKMGKFIDVPTEEDNRLSNSLTYEDIHFYYPKRNFFHNPRINAYRENKIHELFTPRNLMALSFLLNEIDKIKNPLIRGIFHFCFTASVGQASRMVFVVKGRGKTKDKSFEPKRKEVGSWVIGYWVPKENFEINVWNCFENRWQKIIKAKTEQVEIKYKYNEAKNYDELLNTCSNVFLVNDSAINALVSVPDNSVDYVITDPPHGDRIPYLELSMMWNEWLRFNVNYNDEIVVSDSKDRNKSKEEYHRLLNKVLSEIERVLKPDHYFTLIFNSLDDDTWINLVQHINSLKFDLHKIETIGYSANSVVQDNRTGGLKTDFVFIYKKNSMKIIQPIHFYSCYKNKDDFIGMISEYLETNKSGKETYEILNYLVKEFQIQGKVFRLSEAINLIQNCFHKENGKWIAFRKTT